MSKETWKKVLSKPGGLLTVGLAGAGAVLVTALLIWFLPDSPLLVRPGLLFMAVLCYLALAGGAVGFLLAQREAQRRQQLAETLTQEQARLQSTQEQTKKLLSLQEQTLMYAQELNNAVQRERLLVDELDSLQRVSMAVLSELSLEVVLDMVAEAVATLTQADTASVSLLTADDRMRTHVAVYGLAADALRGTSSPADTALHGGVIKSGDPLLVDNLRDTNWRQGRGAIRRDGKKTAIVAPLKVKGRVIGCLSAFDKKLGQPFDEHDLRLLSLFANQAAIAIENARLYEQAHQDLAAKAEQARQIQQSVRESLALVRDLLSTELAGQPAAAQGLQASLHRLQMAAQVYDVLAQHDFEPLTFETLAQGISELLQAAGGPAITLASEPDGVWLTARQALPLALIAGELIRAAGPDAAAASPFEWRAYIADEEIVVQMRGRPTKPRPGVLAALADESSRRIIQNLVDTYLQGRLHVASEGETVTVIVQFPLVTRPAPPPPQGVPLDAALELPSFLHTRRS